MLESYAEIQEEYQMIYTDKTKKAMKLCYEAHKDQVDKSGLPYVFHPAHVAEQMTDEATTIVALFMTWWKTRIIRWKILLPKVSKKKFWKQ